MSRVRVAVVALAALLVACGSDAVPAPDAGATTACTPGQEASCLCPGGVGFAGVLTCAADGSGYGACAGCPPPTDAGDDASDANDSSDDSDAADAE